MKKIVFLISLVFIFGDIVYSQTNILPLPSGNVGIGVTNSPTSTLQIGSGIGNLHCGYNGVLIKFNSGDRALLELHSPDGQNRFIFQSLSYATFFSSLDQKPILMQSEGGNVGIGTYSPEAKLTVKGKIVATEIQVKEVGAIPDYVFKPEYELMPLSHVEDFVKQNQHLPEVPSEKEFKENGMNMAEMNGLLLKKIEELTLYSIAQNKKTDEQNKSIKEQAIKIEALEKAVSNLISK